MECPAINASNYEWDKFTLWQLENQLKEDHVKNNESIKRITMIQINRIKERLIERA